MKLFTVLLPLLLVLTTACEEEDTSRAVRYSITGTANSVSITYQNVYGGVSQIGNTSVPWSLSFTGEPGDFVYVSAQNQGETGKVTAIIFIDDDVFKSSTSSGAFVIATSSGSIP